MAQCANIAWRAFSPETTPALLRRNGHAMAYDSNRRVTVLYGGGELFPHPITRTSDFYGTFGDHWEYDGIIWKQIYPTTKPPPLNNHSMSYDADRRVVVLYGGFNRPTKEERNVVKSNLIKAGNYAEGSVFIDREMRIEARDGLVRIH